MDREEEEGSCCVLCCTVIFLGVLVGFQIQYIYILRILLIIRLWIYIGRLFNRSSIFPARTVFILAIAIRNIPTGPLSRTRIP